MGFDEIPENREQSFPCECGGNISQDEHDGNWHCDSCDFVKTDQRKKINKGKPQNGN